MKIYFVGAHATGKAQPTSALVLTDRGFRLLEGVGLGDTVIGIDGRPTEVVGVFPQGVLPVFRVTLSDGSSTECSDDHLWFTRTQAERHQDSAGSVKRLAELRSCLRTTAQNQPNHHLPGHDPVQFHPIRAALPLHPYVLGLLLGDGSWSGNVRLHNSEPDVKKRFAELLPASDECRPIKGTPDVSVCRRKRTNKPSDTKQALISLGLGDADCYSKKIPELYLLGSKETRIDLLRGLSDTDGAMGPKASVEFSSSSEQLAQDVAFVVRSLGGIVSVRSRVPHYTYKGERLEGAVSYRVYYWFRDGMVTVSSDKHVQRRQDQVHFVGRWIEKVEYVGDKECVCIQVAASDGLYLTNDFIPTHNTTLARWTSRRFGFPMISEVARQVLAEMEVSLLSLRTDLGLVAEYQRKVFERQVLAEQQAGPAFVSDRAFDNLAYASEHTLVVADLLEDPCFLTYVKGVASGLVFFVRPQKDLLREDGTRESPTWEGVVRIDAMVKFMLEQFRVPYLSLDSASMQERVRAVEFVCCR